MSVSLREQELDRLVNLVLQLGALTTIPKELKDTQLKIIKDQILSLIGKCGVLPIKLSVEELEQKIKEHLDWNYPTITVGKHCWSIKELAKFFLALATPTFSGENKCRNCQKTLAECNNKFSPHDMSDCTFYQPIPAEKKECEHEWKRLFCSHISVSECGETFRCSKCSITKIEPIKPEPKPKDRIEELVLGELDQYSYLTTAEKINELIRHINKEI